jgi:hypothetical protein
VACHENNQSFGQPYPPPTNQPIIQNQNPPII